MRKLFQKQDIVIDLTSLLDVIFIVLLLVMCNQQLHAREAQQMTEDAAQKLEEASQLQQAFESHIEKYEETDEYVLFIDVTAAYSEKALTDRTIQVMAGTDAAGQEPYAIHITPQSASDGYQELSEYLSASIEGYLSEGEEAARPVLLTLNKGDDDILYRDEVAIRAVFENLAEKYGNIYLR